MSETASATFQNSNPIKNPVTYWRVSAIALGAVAVLGILLNSIGQSELLGANFLAFDWTHNIVHVVLAAVAAVFGFGNLGAGITKTMAIVFGFVYAGLGILGFIAGDALSGIGLHLELGENLVHIILGAWALTAGFGAKY
jgi:hypothetical protein